MTSQGQQSSLQKAAYSEAKNLSDVTRRLGVTGDGSTVWNLAGLKPTHLSSHLIGGEYCILGMTPGDFLEIHGQAAFDFNQPVAEFKTVCEDYDTPLELETNSMALEFCAKIMFEVGPASRTVNDKTRDKYWVFRFSYKKSDDLVVKTAFVASYKSKESKYEKSTTPATSIHLTIKQAGMLAVMTMAKLIPIALQNNIRLLSPLAGAVFTRDDISHMSTETGYAEELMLQKVNISAQSGSQYLPGADMALAAAITVAVTKKLDAKDRGTRDSIIGKLMKQYNANNHHFKKENFEVYCKYASGGLPYDLQPDTLIKNYEEIRIRVAKAAELASKTSLRTRHDKPGKSDDEDKPDDDDKPQGGAGAGISKPDTPEENEQPKKGQQKAPPKTNTTPKKTTSRGKSLASKQQETYDLLESSSSKHAEEYNLGYPSFGPKDEKNLLMLADTAKLYENVKHLYDSNKLNGKDRDTLKELARQLKDTVTEQEMDEARSDSVKDLIVSLSENDIFSNAVEVPDAYKYEYLMTDAQ